MKMGIELHLTFHFSFFIHMTCLLCRLRDLKQFGECTINTQLNRNQIGEYSTGKITRCVVNACIFMGIVACGSSLLQMK
jgi:hypothetical protein